MTEKPAADNNLRKNKITLLLLAAFFALPYLVVFIYQANPELSVKTGMSNRGELFSPVHSIEPLASELLRDLQGNWSMIYISGSSCDQDCLNQHYTMRQVRLASGKRRYKLQRLNFLTSDAIDADYEKLLAEFPEEHQLHIDDEKLRYDILAQIDDLSVDEKIGRIYLMDPHLNIVLRYSEPTNPKDLLHDINKLVLE